MAVGEAARQKKRSGGGPVCLWTIAMALLQKLLIQGIRSFDPEQREVIEFFSPLTVIVGHNGAGKTVRGRAWAEG